MTCQTSRKIFDRVRRYTMIPAKRFVSNIKIARQLRLEKAFPQGAIAECGVWRGGMSMGFMHVFGTERDYHLYDSFEGLPPPSDNDGSDAHWWRAHPEHPRYFANCRASQQELEIAISTCCPEYKSHVVSGWYKDTLSVPSDIPITAFLHLDSDWYDSTWQALNAFWYKIPPGGAILVDDYYDWEGCRSAVHDFLTLVQAREAIMTVPNGGVLIKRLGAWELSESPHLR